MKVMVLGATGVLGRNVLPRLVEHGHQVVAVVRRKSQIPLLESTGVVAALGDILQPQTLSVAAEGADAVLHLATSIPKGNDSQDWSANDRIRRDGTRNLIAAAEASRASRYIQQSITLLYGDQGGKVVDESTPLQPNRITQSAADMEAQVEASSLDWVILRGGLFYGMGTGAEDGWRSSVRDEEFRVPGDGAGMLSFIHVADMARAVVHCLEEAGQRSIFNVVDDSPTSAMHLFSYVASQEGVPNPMAGGPQALPSLACSNRSIKRALAWAPAYPSFRSGLAR